MRRKPVKRPRGAAISLNLGDKHLAALDQLVDLYQSYAPQVEEYRYRRLNRSSLVRMAILYLLRAAHNGNCGPEILHLSGTRGSEKQLADLMRA